MPLKWLCLRTRFVLFKLGNSFYGDSGIELVTIGTSRVPLMKLCGCFKHLSFCLISTLLSLLIVVSAQLLILIYSVLDLNRRAVMSSSPRTT